jgi:hypothetical protein
MSELDFITSSIFKNVKYHHFGIYLINPFHMDRILRIFEEPKSHKGTIFRFYVSSLDLVRQCNFFSFFMNTKWTGKP